MEHILNLETHELLKFLDEKLNNYLSIEEISLLQNNIVKWYEIKYPTRMIQLSIEQVTGSFRICPSDADIYKLDDLGSNMSYMPLMIRMNENLHSIIECWYQKEKNNTQSNFLSVKCRDKSTLIPVEYSLVFDKHDGYFDITSKKWILEKFKTNYTNIDELVDALNNGKIDKEISSNLDFSELNEIVKTYNAKVEIRKKILNIIALKIFASEKNNMVGYIRTKLFVIEFSKYLYNIDLNIPTPITFQMLNEELEVCNKLVYDLYSDDLDSIENYGITLKGLKLLKKRGVYRSTDLPQNFKISVLYDGVFNEYMGYRDEAILDQIRKKLDEEFSNKLHSKLLSQIANNKIEPEKPIKKKFLKRIFSK